MLYSRCLSVLLFINLKWEMFFVLPQALLALRIHPMAPTWSLALEGLHQSPRHPLGAATKAIGACGRAQLWQWALEVSDFVKVQGGTYLGM